MQRQPALIAEKIHKDASEGASLRFDFKAFVVLSVIMSGFALAQINITVVVASLVLALLMAPMLGLALRIIVKDKRLFIRGTRNEILALVISFGIGILICSVLFHLMPNLITRVEINWTEGILTEITRKGGFNWIDVSIAAVSGIAVDLQISSGAFSLLAMSILVRDIDTITTS